MNVLTVCLGNICRSPMAEMLFKHYARRYGLDLNVRSAGIKVWKGTPMSRNAVEALNRLGVQVEPKVSVQLDDELVRWADVIYVMTDRMLEYCVQAYPEHAHKFEKLSDEDVEDPYGGSLEDYMRTATTINDAVRRKLLSLGFTLEGLSPQDKG